MSLILRRIGQALIVLLLAYTLAFFLLSALPSDGVMARYADPALGLSQAEIDGIRQEMGVDKPLAVQFFTSLAGFFTGNLGYSVRTGTPVSQLIADALPHTLALAAAAVGLAAIVALVTAYVATLPGLRLVRAFFRALPSFLVSLPGFWVAILLLQFVSFRLGWVNVIDPGPLEGLILPALTLSVPMAAPLAQVLIRSIDEVREQPFVQVARSRGATETRIFFRTVLRNASLPPLTMAGLLFGELVGGAVVTETVFGRTGLGSLVVSSVSNRDTPVLLGVVLIAAVAYVLINLVVDLLYPVIDVRLRERSLTPNRLVAA
ncbi:Glutathione transport system permease protein GsiC [Corynebacterium capitovis DSM 44611]|uniref:ABC transporter permease n=1 Tax=Corynebacterium capitovis TaxID=131081 RepID=UPI000362F949|nr:ABC transporter permease [Corynebacterium capitovis]WKD56938.1 Glutathione transport system permease protein GsiC [Corynebacterium capitovis DSM 44611]